MNDGRGVLSRRRLLVLGVGAAVPVLAQDRPRLRALTYNIHHGEGTDGRFDLERIARVITGARPDVAMIQEVDFKTRRAGGADQPAELARVTGLHGRFGRAIDFEGGEYGQVLLSRWPLEEFRVHRLPGGEGREQRILVTARTRPGNGLPHLLLAGTHLCHQSPEDRLAQAREINRLLAARGGPPVILAGDLNARAGSDPILEIEKQWLDTLPGERKIDYVLARRSDPWKVIEARIIDDRVASDHPAVLAVLDWAG
jgi:endonuclease/exonuclease/phosphatase family metal-dependent hydrolase